MSNFDDWQNAIDGINRGIDLGSFGGTDSIVVNGKNDLGSNFDWGSIINSGGMNLNEGFSFNPGTGEATPLTKQQKVDGAKTGGKAQELTTGIGDWLKNKWATVKDYGDHPEKAFYDLVKNTVGLYQDSNGKWRLNPVAALGSAATLGGIPAGNIASAVNRVAKEIGIKLPDINLTDLTIDHPPDDKARMPNYKLNNPGYQEFTPGDPLDISKIDPNATPNNQVIPHIGDNGAVDEITVIGRDGNQFRLTPADLTDWGSDMSSLKDLDFGALVDRGVIQPYDTDKNKNGIPDADEDLDENGNPKNQTTVHGKSPTIPGQNNPGFDVHNPDLIDTTVGGGGGSTGGKAGTGTKPGDKPGGGAPGDIVIDGGGGNGSGGGGTGGGNDPGTAVIPPPVAPPRPAFQFFDMPGFKLLDPNFGRQPGQSGAGSSVDSTHSGSDKPAATEDKWTTNGGFNDGSAKIGG